MSSGNRSLRPSYLEEGVRILELARNAQRLFKKQKSREKRRLLNFVVSNCSWKGGELTATLRQPFDLLAETTAIAAQAARFRCVLEEVRASVQQGDDQRNGRWNDRL